MSDIKSWQALIAILLLVVVFPIFKVTAQDTTYILGGTFAHDSTWTVANSPYVVQDCWIILYG